MIIYTLGLLSKTPCRGKIPMFRRGFTFYDSVTRSTAQYYAGKQENLNERANRHVRRPMEKSANQKKKEKKTRKDKKKDRNPEKP